MIWIFTSLVTFGLEPPGLYPNIMQYTIAESSLPCWFGIIPSKVRTTRSLIHYKCVAYIKCCKNTQNAIVIPESVLISWSRSWSYRDVHRDILLSKFPSKEIVVLKFLKKQLNLQKNQIYGIPYSQKRTFNIFTFHTDYPYVSKKNPKTFVRLVIQGLCTTFMFIPIAYVYRNSIKKTLTTNYYR